MSKTVKENATGDDLRAMIVRCEQADLDLFDRAALATGYVRGARSDVPNRSQWALTMLRAVANEQLEEHAKGLANDKNEKIPTGSRAKR